MLLRLFSGKKTVLLNEWYCDNWVATQNEVGSVAHPYTTVNSKLIKDLNIRIKTIKFLQLNIEVRSHDFGFGNGFFGYDTKSMNKRNK